jgi:hypothetical protein
MLALVGVIAFLRPVGGGTSEQASGFNTVSAELQAAPTTAAAATTEFMAPGALYDRSAKRERLPGGNATELGLQIRDLLDSADAESAAAAGASYDTEDKPCIDRVEGDVLLTVDTTLDGKPVIVYVTGNEDGLSARAFDPDTCNAVEIIVPD